MQNLQLDYNFEELICSNKRIKFKDLGFRPRTGKALIFFKAVDILLESGSRKK